VKFALRYCSRCSTFLTAESNGSSTVAWSFLNSSDNGILVSSFFAKRVSVFGSTFFLISFFFWKWESLTDFASKEEVSTLVLVAITYL